MDSKLELESIMPGRVKFDEPMSRHTSLKVGGPASVYAKPSGMAQLSKLLDWRRLSMPELNYIPVGSGTNLLVRDSGISQMVIDLSSFLSTTSKSSRTGNVLLVAGAGVKTVSLCRFTIRNGFSGLNMMLGIPGTIGGAAMMNAGTSTGSMGDIIESVIFMTESGQILTKEKKDLDFAYRKMSVKGFETASILLLKVCMNIKSEKFFNLGKEAQQILKKRKKTQPAGVASAGCFFKNPENNKSAGELIDQAGLKGKMVGGAQVSTKHANFIINKNKATAADIMELARLVQETVRNTFGVNLETEVKILG
ncbi:UDP-N-acetylmuramate dehydrogenase [Desulfobacterales bacterium HSG16]|nr:UDP-N-acetylmuramate dehydrogenase [Desulfobacterales bacterium HSG16]